MKRDTFLKRLHEGKPLVADGAMGTLLHDRGVNFDSCFDELNLTNPALVGSIHQEYIKQALRLSLPTPSAQIVYKLERCGLEELIDEINQTGVELARRIVPRII